MTTEALSAAELPPELTAKVQAFGTNEVNVLLKEWTDKRQAVLGIFIGLSGAGRPAIQQPTVSEAVETKRQLTMPSGQPEASGEDCGGATGPVPITGTTMPGVNATTPPTVGASPSGVVQSQPSGNATQVIALVYDGPGASCCSKPLGDLIQSDTNHAFQVVYVGGSGQPTVQAGLQMPGAKLYAQPGATGDESAAFQQQQSDVAALQTFVKGGGRFIGICMGAYLASKSGGASPGYDLLPMQALEYITESGADVTSEVDSAVQVTWRGASRTIFFQDGASFSIPQGAAGITTLATYSNGQVAALVAPYGSGKVGVSGPHPELADPSVGVPDGSTTDLGHDLIDTLMQ